MASENETVAEIVKEMRDEFPPKYCSSKHCHVEVHQPVRSFADRIEAAWQRERKPRRNCDRFHGEFAAQEAVREYEGTWTNTNPWKVIDWLFDPCGKGAKDEEN